MRGVMPCVSKQEEKHRRMDADKHGMTRRKYCIRNRQAALCRGFPACAGSVSRKPCHLHLTPRQETERRHA